MAIVATNSRVPPEWLGQRAPDSLVYEKYTAPDGSRRRRKKFSEWERIAGSREESETDDDVEVRSEDLNLISSSELGDKAEIYTVVYKRIAVRKEPSLDGKVLNMVEKGQLLKTFGWDPTQKWRKIHFRLPGGSGNLVAAWVLVKHDQLGPLLRKAGENDADESSADGQQASAKRLLHTGEAQNSQRGIALDASNPDSQAFVLNKDELRLAAHETPMQGRGQEEKDGWTDFLASVGQKKVGEVPDGEQESDADSIATRNFDFVSGEEALVLVNQGSLLYEVTIRPKGLVYSKPSKESAVIGKVDFQSRLHTFGWDVTNNWRKVCCEVRPSGKLLTGWLMVHHPEGFDLMVQVDT